MKKAVNLIMGLFTVGLLANGLFVMSVEGLALQTQTKTLNSVLVHQGNP